MAQSVVEEAPEKTEYDCPVCFDLILPPVFQCCNGHLICGECIEPIRICPLCRDALPSKKIRNLAVEKIVREMKRPCPYSKMGCKELLTYSEGFEDHKLRCFYAPSNYCSLLGLGLTCTEKVTIGNLFNHVSKSNGHFTCFECAKGQELKLTESSLQPLQNLDGKRQQLGLIRTRDQVNQVFILKCIEDVNEKTISWAVLIIGTDKMAREFNASIKIKPTHPAAFEGVTKSTLLKWKGPISYLNKDAASANTNTSTNDLFCISYERFPTLFHSERGTSQLRWEIVLKLYSALELEKPKKTNQTNTLTTFGPMVIHRDVYCKGCQDDLFLTGPRHKCIECDNYNLCGNCIRKRIHAHHLFVTIPHPNMTSQLQRAKWNL